MIFKKLFLGDTVATSGTKVFKKLTTEEPQDDSIVGTWVFNQPWYAPSSYGKFNINFDIYFSYNDSHYAGTKLCVGYNNGGFISGDSAENRFSVNDSISGYWVNFSGTSSYQLTLVIHGGSDIDNVNLKTWLKANATKQ